MKLLWSTNARADYPYWREHDREVLHRINALLRDVMRSPFTGLGKPEPLVGDLKGWWSRRIASDHRLVYRIVGTGTEQRVEVISCRYHYSRRG